MRRAVREHLETIAAHLAVTPGDVDGVIRFSCSCAEGVSWDVVPVGGRYSVREGARSSPSCTIHTDLPTLARIAAGEVDFRNPADVAGVRVTGPFRYLAAVTSAVPGRGGDWHALFARAEATARACPVTAIARHAAPTLEFVLDCQRRSTPVLLSGVTDTWKARGWSFASLAARFGDVVYTRTGDRDVSLGEQIRALLAGRCRTTGGVSLPPELSAEIALPRWGERLATRGGFLFLGAAGAVTPLHRDAGDGMNAHILGKKSWTLFSPDQTRLLYPRRSAAIPGFEVCDVDPTNPDLHRHPLFRDARPLHVTVLPGEVLLVPNGWYHEVRLLEPSLSVAFPLFAPRS